MDHALEKWIDHQAHATREGARCVRIVLHHTSSNSRLGREFVGFDVPSDIAKSFPGDLAEQLFEQAESDAEGQGGVVTYAICAYYQGQPTPGAQRKLRIVPEDDDAIDSASTNGLMQQLMRHNEATARMLAASTANFLQTAEERMAAVEKQNEQLRSERFKSMEVVQNLMSLAHERELATESQKRKLRLMEDSASKLLGILGPVGQKLLATIGPELAPAPDADEPETVAAIRELITSLEPDQLQGLQETLSEKQLATVLALWRGFQTEEAAASTN